ncbi:MAG: hypothetical protein HYS08_01805 [Chlamydiae bacterium]|nr:hypothetical protein [Chlamydiota bacterium]
MGYVNSQNLYAYVGNNPWNRTDPGGTKSLWDKFWDWISGDDEEESDKKSDSRGVSTENSGVQIGYRAVLGSP